MKISRRNVIKASMAMGAAASFPSLLRAQASIGGEPVKWSHGVPQAFDPYTTTDVDIGDYAFGVYDMLFGLDSKLVPQPQMIGDWSASDDKRTYTFQLRDGLSWHDHTKVTAADCVASIRRWFLTPGGSLVQQRAQDVSIKDDKTFIITLKEPLGLLIDQLAQVSTYPLFIMREKDADRPPSEAVTTHVGSGPFKFNEELFVPGANITFDKFEEYVPRSEAPDGLAGGKIARVSRVIWNDFPDQQTAVSALQAGEIDFLGAPPADLYPVIESDPNLVLEDLYKSGYNYFLRMNCLQKPFNNVKARQAMLHLINQEAFLRIINPSPQYSRPVKSLFGIGTAYTNEANTDWYKEGGDAEAAKRLFAEAGYAGEKVVILDPTDWGEAHNASLLLASEMRKIGINAELASTDWAGLVTRRAKKVSVDEGGWSIFISSATDFQFGDPTTAAWMAMNGEESWFGWPESAEYEALRAKWPDVETLEERQALAREMQQVWWNYASLISLGQVVSPVAYRKDLTGLVGLKTGNVPMWNMQKG
ncbi:ABC transporter substrate-binding protein [Rhizobium bangladeshense]|uniref:ABC transporter substrate-binding protein n=1 Tax=Rhizobium bangladeshense TaxID=1138189 RepID=UPI001C83B252|nr:ABC transporter substrate-binding protein [Rhizobium bangladeshense]MBX4917470.1 ABC transporter substrate-binding protein [Rhizobium bangladeshense]